MEAAEFVDGNAPEYFASGLQAVEPMGAVCRFVLYVVRRTAGGVLFREPAFTCIMPVDAVGPAVALTVRTIGAGIIIPAIGSAAWSLLTVH